MQLFRKLAGNVFFKIILAFVAITFVLFGISGFILGSPNSWVAKVGSSSISYNSFLKALQADRDMVLAANKSEEAVKYVDSEQFKSEVLGRLVNKLMIEKIKDEFGVDASKRLILEAAAKDPNFKNDAGKFDREKFKNFLAKNGLNEERYVNEVSGDVVATMIIQTIAMSYPTNSKIVLETENFKQEKRLADVITISAKNVENVAAPSAEEINNFFEKNKANYTAPEMRTVSYMSFSRQNFAKDLAISDQEIFAEYEKNKELFLEPESRNFYHILFEKEEDAKEFLQKLNSLNADKSQIKGEFAKLAKDLQKKDLKAITLNKVTQKDLIPQLADAVFKLNLNQNSEVLQSPLGFHVFLLVEIKQSRPIPFNEVKSGIKQKMAEGRADKVIQDKISAIDDALLTSNSLTEVAKKFNFKIGAPVKINQKGQNENGQEVVEIKDLGNFAQNAFALKENQTSKIFYGQNGEGFYALKVEKITAAHDQKLEEVKAQIVQDILNQKRREGLQILAKTIGDELKANPDSAMQIAAKYHLKLERNREFPRIFYINFQGRQVPYQNEFLTQLFKIKINQITDVLAAGEQDFMVGILREIKPATITPAQFEQAKKQAAESFKNEILQTFNGYLLEKNPVKVNEKIIGKKEENK